MGMLVRRDFSKGWWPSADAYNAPQNCLSRADNLTLDKRGIVSVRQGSSKINGSALADTDIHSLFTTHISGTRYRMAGANDAVYANSTLLSGGAAGSGDIAFGADQGQVFWARSTTKKKYDGSTVRNWGIARPGAAPTVAAVAQVTSTVATFNSAESPAFTAEEGTITGTFPSGEDGTANGALEATPNATTGRASVRKEWGSSQDFSTIGGVAEDPSDIFDIAVYIKEPERVQEITVMFGIGSDTADHFRTDHYYFDFKLGAGAPSSPQTISVVGGAVGTAAAQTLNRAVALPVAPVGSTPSPAPAPPSSPDPSATEEPPPDVPERGTRERFLWRARRNNRELIARERKDRGGSPNWTHLVLSRAQFNRVGATSGRNWTTVRAFKVIYKASAGATGVVRFDNAQFISGKQAHVGTYKAMVSFVYSSGTYFEESPASAESAEIVLNGQKVDVTVSAATMDAADSQVNKVAVYLIGGLLDQYYRVSTLGTRPGAGNALTITVSENDIEMLLAYNPYHSDNANPPDNIIGIAGPHYDRLAVLDNTGLLHLSQRRRPGQFMTAHALRVGNASETPYWVVKTTGGLYVGTSRDIIRVSGNGDLLEDGTLDFKVERMNVGSPPVDAAVAQWGENIAYRASDGFRLFSGVMAVPFNREAVELLFRGNTRHSVSPLNLTTGRFRCALSARGLTFLAPEGASTTSTQVLYRYEPDTNNWERYTWATPNWRVIYTEPDGTLIAGDNAGFVWTLDTGTADDSAAIPIVLWTPRYDCETPLQSKDPVDQLIWLLTLGGTATVAYHLDGSGSAQSSYEISATTNLVPHKQLIQAPGALFSFKLWQLRITGSFTNFQFNSLALSYTTRPQTHVLVDTGWFSAESKDLAWLREVRALVNATENVKLYVYLDGSSVPTINGQLVPVTPNQAEILSVPLGREIKGSTFRVMLASATSGGFGSIGFECYWVEPIFDLSGVTTQKKQWRYVPDGERAA